MEPRLGADLSAVRVHAGGESSEAADQLGARAFTVGNDVHFGGGQFSPNTKEGDKLIAHELTHVVQGQKSGIQRKPRSGEHDSGEANAHEHVSQPDEPAEKEADVVADHVGEELHGDGHKQQGAPDATPSADNAGEKIARKPREDAASALGGGRKIFRQPHDAKQSAGQSGKRDIDKRPGAGASDEDWVHYLSDLHRFLRDQTGAEKEQLLDIRANREAHPVVGAISEAAASAKAREGVKLPDEGIWDQVFAQLNKAHALFAGDKRDIEGAKRELARAVKMFEDAHRRVYEYRTRTEGGAETAAHTLRGVEIGCDITLTILSAGVGAGSANLLKLGARGAFKLLAEQAGKSLVKTGAKAAAVGGANKLAQGAAEQGSSKALGVDNEFDVAKVLREAGEAAVMNFLGVLVGGSLSKVFMRTLGEILGARMAPEALLTFAEKYGVQGAVPPELFVSKGWRFLVGVAGDACTTTLLTALSTLVEQLRSGGKRPTGEQFVAMVVQQMIQNGLLQVLFTAMTHGKGGHAADTAGKTESSSSSSAAATHAPDAPHGAASPKPAGAASYGADGAHAPSAADASHRASPPKPAGGASHGADGAHAPSAANESKPLTDEEKLARLERLRAVDDPAKVEESKKNDEAFHHRKADNAELEKDPARLEADLKAAGISKEKYLAMKQGAPESKGERVPLCFDNNEQFGQFKQELAALVDAIQVGGKPVTASAKMIGTSVNFYSGNPKKPLGHHFDKRGPKTGDVDIELTSPELASELLNDPNSAGNDKVLVGGKKQIFKNEVKKDDTVVGGFHARFPQFREFCAKWSKILGRGTEKDPAVDIKLKMDVTPISKVPRPSGGPIEVLRKE